MNTFTPVSFTPEEKAILEGKAGPTETKDDTGADKPNTPDSSAGPGKADETGNADPAPVEQPDGDEEDVTEVADGTNPDGPPRRKVINFGAYEKQRHRANKVSEELAKAKEQIAYLSGLAQNKPAEHTQPQAQTQEIPLTPPDKAKEPEKYLEWLERGMATLLQKQQQAAQQSEQTSHFSQINNLVVESEQAFINGDPENNIEPHPDFADAVKHLQDRHRAELKLAGYNAQEIQQIMAARAQSVAAKAIQAGDSPAKRVYELAKLSGYKKAAPPKVETEAEKIARQAENQKKGGKTISELPGGESKGGLTAEALANMNPEDFKKQWDSGAAKKLIGWNQ